MAVGQTVLNQRADRYHVEIRHPGGDWHQIHPPAWEHTTDPDTAREYATTVQRDHPGSQVRIIRTIAVTITTIATGKTRTGELGTEVINL